MTTNKKKKDPGSDSGETAFPNKATASVPRKNKGSYQKPGRATRNR